MRQKKIRIPYGRQSIWREDIEAVVEVLRSDYLTQGPKVVEFERGVSEFCGVKYAVSFSSGTAALHAACFAAGVTKDDEVITSAMTFAASANCVLYLGGKPVFADIRSDLPIIDSLEISRKVTKKTKAIIPVDFSGIPADYDQINTLAKKNNLVVIADAAHSFGGFYKGRKVGTLADMSVFSFHPVKLITTGEGGMVVTNNPTYYQKLLLFRTHGITKDRKLLHQKNVGPWYYEMQFLGFNFRLTELQAALGNSQLKHALIFLKRRHEIAQLYMRLFENNDSVNYLSVQADRHSAWHLFPILLTRNKYLRKRKDIVERLHSRGIIVQIHYVPVHLHPYYKKILGHKEGDFPNAEMFYRSEISLPIFPLLTDTQIKFIAKNIFSVLQQG